MNKPHVSVVLFQHDLRIDDQLSLAKAIKQGLPVIGVYLYPANTDKPTAWGFHPSGPFRHQFLWESLQDLKKNLLSLNIPMYVWMEDHLQPEMFSSLHVEHVFAAVEPGDEEKLRMQYLIKTLGNPTLTLVHDKPLCSPLTYPWLLTNLPQRFTDARIEIEKNIRIDAPVFISTHQQTSLPILEDDWQRLQARSSLVNKRILGGETEAKKHLHQYFFVDQHVLTYRETRNNMLAFQDSSKLSPALSLGLLSARYIYAQLMKVEATLKKNQSTYWLWFELLWRDFFYYLHLQVGRVMFFEKGIQNLAQPWVNNATFINAILMASTGYPLVDANLKELYQTGWMSNRGRQNVANFISKILRLDWRFGAALFEHYLIDYDVSSNYGNWQYLSGIGTDPREDRIFNVTLQAKKYDPTGEYLATWLPKLQHIPTPLRFQPWTMNGLQMGMYQCEIGKDYPQPIVNDSRIQLKY
jgi:deoxyribodipyrimidine photo-lyase